MPEQGTTTSNNSRRQTMNKDNNTIECECCNKRFPKDEICTLTTPDGSVEYEHLCEDCEMMLRNEADPEATVFYNDDDYPHIITAYEDATEGDFKTSWHATDGWRGYFDITPSDQWTPIHSDCILSHSYDAEQLEKFDKEFQQYLLSNNINYARVFTRTSNLFSTGYDLFVESSKVAQAQTIRVFLSLKYRDPHTFNMTALTGKDPDEWTENDELFVKSWNRIKNGEDPEKILKELQGDA